MNTSIGNRDALCSLRRPWIAEHDALCVNGLVSEIIPAKDEEVTCNPNVVHFISRSGSVRVNYELNVHRSVELAATVDPEDR